ncbi:MAG: CHAT domain-containing protein, partial [Leptospiraceae bacterium]|nr:CHAT domain-containing protein [Leptospiraceae bacterium]
LHDGRGFLADRFFPGKNIAGYWQDVNRKELDRLRVLIIADPTEDLEWARQEGEALFESLHAEVPADLLDLQFMSGRRVTKLGILNAIKDRDIIHYAGHVYHDCDEQESGWLLKGGKVLRAREIEKVGALPRLVFSNSCLSVGEGESPCGGRQSETADVKTPMGKSLPTANESGSGSDGANAAAQGTRFNELAGAFLRTGICNYIGTNWEIQDSAHTYDFALNFYREIFQERSVGEALHAARSHARQFYGPNDLTWANYSLHGNPMARIFRMGRRRTFDASRIIRQIQQVIEAYPQPIAAAYKSFSDFNHNGESDLNDGMSRLVRAFRNTMLVTGALVFGHTRYYDLGRYVPDPDSFKDLREWTQTIYNCIQALYTFDRRLSAQRMMEYLHLHRDHIYKLLDWTENYERQSIPVEEMDSYLVTFHYQLDNLLTDLTALGRFKFLYVPARGEQVVLLNGLKERKMDLIPAESSEPDLARQLETLRGRTCFFNTARKLLVALDPYMTYQPENEQIKFCEFIREASPGKNPNIA